MRSSEDTLAPYASRASTSRGRLHAERTGADDNRSEARDGFQRDRDRIVHSTGFRRLRHKTQVFIAPDGDHYRVRLTHSLEVAQIGRTIARALGLNEDLTEALCLAHDIGHPPFGHAGEDALKAAMADHGGFDHNGHTLRTLMLLDSPYPRHDGLNLCWETLEGLAKHNGPVAAPGWALTSCDARFPLDLGSYGSLEAQVATVADDIAYDNHDIDDGLRAGLLSIDELLSHPFVRAGWDKVRSAWPGVPEDRLIRELIREQIGRMVGDVIAQSRAAIVSSGITTPEEGRGAERAIIGFSPELATAERSLKRFMYRHLYHHAAQLATADEALRVVSGLFAAYAEEPALMGADWASRMPIDEPDRTRHIGDFIAGMTDRFALSRYAEIHGLDQVPPEL